jgi:hypothetical protein
VNGTRTYCEQLAYPGMPLTLYHNNHDGIFTDGSATSGVDKLVGRAYQKNGTFKDDATESELAYDPNGLAKAGMGIDAGDANGDGLPDFVVTNFNDQYHSLLIGSKSGVYEDRTVASHLAAMTRNYVGWGKAARFRQ